MKRNNRTVHGLPAAIAAALLLAALPASAEPPRVAANGSATDTGSVAYTLEDIRMLAVPELSDILQFLKDSPFQNPDKRDAMVSLGTSLHRPLRTHQKWTYAEGVPMEDRSVMRWTDDALRYLDMNVRPKVAGLLIQTATLKTPEAYSRLEKVEKWINSQDFPEKFKRFDGRWEETMDWFGKNRGLWRPEVEFRNVLAVTRLDDYSAPDGRTAAWFDRLVRTLDNYLLSVSDSELKQTEELLDKVATMREEAVAAVKLFRETYESTNGYKHTKRLADYYTKIFEASAEAEQAIRAKIAGFKDSSTPVGKLRTCRDVGSAVLADSTSVNNGCPAYTRRVRFALQQAKDLFDRWKRENELKRP